jgi:hypothetical protein
MQVVCSNCQLSFDAPDGATGLVCPICRGPLRPQSADGSAAKTALEWNAGDLDDLIGILSGPAVCARVEVLPAVGDVVAGEVHLLAGGVSDALVDGKSTDDALDRLREVKPARFRIEGRLPNPANGDLGQPGPEAGTLEGRALAHLMRYCEDYVITCSIEVWRGNENARVDYKRGEISGVTVSGIDAPERLAEVMQWSSGNYRLVVPPIQLPAVAPKRPPAVAATPAPVPAPAPSAQAARHGSATKTIFGMPAAEVMKARAASEAARAAADSGKHTLVSAPAATAPPKTATPAPGVKVTPPPVATPAVTPPVSSSQRPSATKTMFGVPTPEGLAGFAAASAPSPQEPEPAAPEAIPAQTDRKTGARKVSVPGPDVVAVPASAPASAPVAAAPRAAAAPAATGPVRAETTEPVRRYSAPAPTLEKPRPAKKETSIIAYVGVGITFGVALLGIYHLVGLLAH